MSRTKHILSYSIPIVILLFFLFGSFFAPHDPTATNIRGKYLSSSASFYVPARIGEDVSEQVRETAVKVYRAMECRGLARVDFFVRRDDQEVVFNEINTIPGFTSISMYPRLFAASGIEYPELIDNLIALALEE